MKRSLEYQGSQAIQEVINKPEKTQMFAAKLGTFPLLSEFIAAVLLATSNDICDAAFKSQETNVSCSISRRTAIHLEQTLPS